MTEATLCLGSEAIALHTAGRTATYLTAAPGELTNKQRAHHDTTFKSSWIIHTIEKCWSCWCYCDTDHEALACYPQCQRAAEPVPGLLLSLSRTSPQWPAHYTLPVGRGMRNEPWSGAAITYFSCPLNHRKSSVSFVENAGHPGSPPLPPIRLLAVVPSVHTMHPSPASLKNLKGNWTNG